MTLKLYFLESNESNPNKIIVNTVMVSNVQSITAFEMHGILQMARVQVN